MSNQPKRKTPEELARAQMLRGYRLQIEDEELIARMNRASYEKMYYFIEGTKIIPEYSRLVDEQQKLRAEQMAKADAAINQALTSGAVAEPSMSEPEPNPEAESGGLHIDSAAVE